MNHYETLGIRPGSSTEEIKKAYRKKAFELHPDKNQGDAKKEEAFKSVNEAYSILGDPEKRAEYDFKFRQHDPKPKAPIEYEEPGLDIEVDLLITLLESYHGAMKSVTVEDKQACSHCNSTGSEPGYPTHPCHPCNETGYFKDPFGIGYKPCLYCRGRKYVIRHPCSCCNGRGSAVYQRTFNVKIPLGVTDGSTLKFPGLGRKGHPPGNLYVKLSVSTHPKYSRSGNDFIFETRVPIDKMILGGHHSISVPTGMTYDIEIPPASQVNSPIYIRGMGFKDPSGANSGDIVVVLNPEMPTGVSPRGQELLSDLMDELKNHNFIRQR